MCGLSSFGYSGTIAHVVLASAPASDSRFSTQCSLYAFPFLGSYPRRLAHREAGLAASRRAARHLRLRNVVGACLHAARAELFRGHRVGGVPLLPGVLHRVCPRGRGGGARAATLLAQRRLPVHNVSRRRRAGVWRAARALAARPIIWGAGHSSRRDEGALTMHADMRLRLRTESTSAARLDVAETQARCRRRGGRDVLRSDGQRLPRRIPRARARLGRWHDVPGACRVCPTRPNGAPARLRLLMRART